MQQASKLFSTFFTPFNNFVFYVQFFFATWQLHNSVVFLEKILQSWYLQLHLCLETLLWMSFITGQLCVDGI